MAYLVTGRKDTGGSFPRLEVRILQQDPEQWSLFILANSALQGLKPPAGNPWPVYPAVPAGAQWLNIGGIHGLPFERWPGDPSGQKDPRGDDGTRTDDPEPGDPTYGGYCTHGSVLFPTWHRPLIMLVEQALGEVAVNLADQIAKRVPAEGDKWKAAATKLRQPFWDWLDPRTGTEGLPTLFTDATIQIKEPGTNTPFSIANPLQTFHFNSKLPPGFESPYTQWPRTIRHPTRTRPVTDDVKQLNAALKGGYRGLASQWASILAAPDDIPEDQWASAWDDFSNTNPQSNPPWPYGPIEGPHNSIHNYCGGTGHLGDPAYAGFDPLFYAHHANVDRLIDIWTKLYPDYWLGQGWQAPDGQIQSFQQPGSTYDQLVASSGFGYNVNEASGLLPFRSSNGSYWSSKDAFGPVALYYSYPSNDDNITDESVTASSFPKVLAATAPAQKVLAANVQTLGDPGHGKEENRAPSSTPASATAQTGAAGHPGATAPHLAAIAHPAATAHTATPIHIPTTAHHQRSKWRADLQRRHGLDPHAEAKKLKNSKSPLFQGAKKEHCPKGHCHVNNYRYFVIDVELFEYGFSGSHDLTVYTHAGERIGTVSVFSRENDASCPSCQVRRAAGNVVRGVIPVPPTIVAEILEKGGWDADENEVAIQNFKNSLRAEITKPGGPVLAHINAANPPAALAPLPATSIPKITLRSAYAAHPDLWEDGPIKFYGWGRHDKVFDEGSWHKEA